MADREKLIELLNAAEIGQKKSVKEIAPIVNMTWRDMPVVMFCVLIFLLKTAYL